MTNLTIAAELGERLKAANQTVAVAESSTGGLICAALLAVPGASAYFRGGSVIYTGISRRELMGVNADDVRGIEPLTEPMAAHFAKAARAQLDATWGIAELGAAGPTGTRYGHDAGTSVIAVDGPVNLSITIATGLSDRETNMSRFTEAAIELLLRALNDG
ncbi:MAG: CinA family protein [Gammaproteobacteria bacterium]|nr:CinA family protein [Gammaproteobacteria bacterium]